MVPPDSHGISRAPCYLGYSSSSRTCFVYGGLTLYAGPFASPSTTHTVSYCLTGRQTDQDSPTTPPAQPLPGITRERFSLIRFRSPLLSESRLFSLPAGTEMFHFPAFPPHALYIQARVTAHDDGRVSPFGHPRITARLAAPRGLSRPPTSFIGSWCQGIHRAPLKTWPQRCSRPLCRSQTPTDSHQTPRHHAYRHRKRPAVGGTVRGSEPSRDNRPAPTAAKAAEPGPFPQDPTVCRTDHPSHEPAFHALDGQYLRVRDVQDTDRISQRSTHERPLR